MLTSRPRRSWPGRTRRARGRPTGDGRRTARRADRTAAAGAPGGGRDAAVNAVSRALHVGRGTVLGGRAGLAVDASLLGRLAAGRPVALVSGTNGKTTTTRLLAVAVEEGTAGAVVTNATGANMPAGHVAALSAGPPSVPVVLEVDESYLPGLVRCSPRPSSSS